MATLTASSPPAGFSNESRQALADWVPMPRYLLRRWVVRRIIQDLQPRDFIEIGAASGEMAKWISKRNIPGIAVEISPNAIGMLHERFADDPTVRVFTEDRSNLSADTEMLLSMEVLEHIEDDRAALANWFDLIRPGGHLLLSVPAHQKLFSAEDELVGHFRRYEKHELIEKLRCAGFEQPEILSYGFPLSWLLKQLRTLVARRRLRTDARSRQQRTEASGVERKSFRNLKWILNDVCFFPLNILQMPFLRFDLSDGYIALARKPQTPQTTL